MMRIDELIIFYCWEGSYLQGRVADINLGITVIELANICRRARGEPVGKYLLGMRCCNMLIIRIITRTM